jgi:5-methylcytosine-specific restriction endonuclease McrA
MASKPRPKYNQSSVIRGALRRAFARSPLVLEIVHSSRREVPRYKKDGTRHKKNSVQRQCQVCFNWVSSSKIAVDHIVPVIDVDTGFIDWNTFIDRLWCDKKNLQIICDSCHNKKTNNERIARLTKQYLQEIEDIALILKQEPTNKDLIKRLNKYIAKRKVVGLESVVQKAQAIKDEYKNRR